MKEEPIRSPERTASGRRPPAGSSAPLDGRFAFVARRGGAPAYLSAIAGSERR